ncbi:MAG: R3H domain-containing nucleic acid-binding protein [Bryobacteraceae bacterium]
MPKYTVAETGPRLDAFLRTVLQAAGFAVKWDIVEGSTPHPDIEKPEVMVKFSGQDVGELLANKAEVLLALEQLSMESLRMPSEDHSLLCFDANDYRMLRIEELRMSAITAAERVKKTKVPFIFSPMNSRERRIIHLALRGETELRSESVGIGQFRQVAVVPEGMPTPPAPPPPPMRRPMGGGDRGGFGGDRRGGPGGDRRGGPGGDRRGGRPGGDRRGPRPPR